MQSDFQDLLGLTRKACEKYDLIDDGDKIAIGLSGGKDSLMLLTLLAKMKIFYPKKYELVAISIDLFNGKTDYSKIKNYCDSLGVEFYIKPSQIKEIVFDIKKESNPCSLCAKLRRGILNGYAKSLGCNKVALGHHKDDILQTFYLSMFYEGRLNTFMPITYLSNTNLYVIRPMIFINESDIKKLSKSLALPILHNDCPADHKTEREHISQIIDLIKKEIPISKERAFNAIISADRYNLFDKLNKK